MKAQFSLILSVFLSRVVSSTSDLLSGHISETSLQKPEHANTTEASNTYNETREIEEMFDWFVGQLRSFIVTTHFDTFRFQVVANRLNDDLVDIVSLGRHVIPWNRHLSAQLRFATSMYDDMVFAERVLVYFSYIGSPETYLVNRIVDLNVRLFLLINSHGYVDATVADIVEKLLSFWKEISKWSDYFRELDDVPGHLSDLFETELFRAERTIGILFSQIPRRQKMGKK